MITCDSLGQDEAAPLRLYELFLESIRILERRLLLLRCGARVSDGKGPCPFTPRRAIGPLDTLFFVPCTLFLSPKYDTIVSSPMQ